MGHHQLLFRLCSQMLSLCCCYTHTYTSPLSRPIHCCCGISHISSFLLLLSVLVRISSPPYSHSSSNTINGVPLAATQRPTLAGASLSPDTWQQQHSNNTTAMRAAADRQTEQRFFPTGRLHTHGRKDDAGPLSLSLVNLSAYGKRENGERGRRERREREGRERGTTREKIG